MLDLVIRGGDVVDGTGAARRRADVAVQDRRVVRVGEVDEDAATTIDATGKVVTPGFVDVHTHFDAQVFWDPALSPSPLHGVTTALAGNCGFTIAPLSGEPADSEYLMRMLARVEGMPLESLREGVPWSWRGTAEYLDLLEGSVGLNLGVMVGHSAIRRIVLHDDANRRAATPDEVAAMARLLHEGLDAGALGFSSSWARTHNDADGQPVPSRSATREELLELCRVAGAHEGTSLEFIPMVGSFEDWSRELMADMSVAAQRALNWNVLAATANNREMVDGQLAAGDVARAKGGKVVALTLAKPFGIRLSFASGFLLDAIPGWEAVMGLPRPYKTAILADPAARRELDATRTRSGSPFAALADPTRMTIFDVVADENQEYVGRPVAEIAAEQGRDPWDVLCDIAVADELFTSFGLPAPEESDEDWRTRLDVWRDDRAVIGASDAGAHLDMLASFNYTTVVLGERPVRVELLTNRTSAADRRRLAAGLQAGEVDVVIGTHALIYGEVEFQRLGVAVIDEQHRFGVEQRALLRARGGPDAAGEPDVLVMTATPIPRTAAMLVYGDLDKSELRELPPGRTPITTEVVGPGPLERQGAYDRLRSEVARGRQGYVICPLVEGSPRVEAKAATEELERLAEEELDGLRLGLLHGQLPAAEKELVMRAFRANELDVLVATTVVEVGVDVPNATVMIVEDADRFGLSQLHQLRGRVGRGPDPSWCFLFADPATTDAEERLTAMAESNDGFLLAERDLEIRGAGEVFGERQAGFSDLKLGRIPRDEAIVVAARRMAEAILDDDPELARHEQLREEVEDLLGDAVEFLFKS